MIVLAFETSTPTLSVALRDGARVVLHERDDGAHSNDLFALCDAVLAEAGVARGALDQLACGAGPGSFTGLRVGLASAKGIAFALGRPLVTVSSLAALALDGAAAAPADAALVALADARRGEVFAGLYRKDGDLVAPLAEDRLLEPGGFEAWLAAHAGGRPAVLLGDPALAAAVGRAGAGGRATPSAAAVAALAAGGRGLDGRTAGPAYLRPAEVELKFPDGIAPGGSFVPKRG